MFPVGFPYENIIFLLFQEAFKKLHWQKQAQYNSMKIKAILIFWKFAF